MINVMPFLEKKENVHQLIMYFTTELEQCTLNIQYEY